MRLWQLAIACVLFALRVAAADPYIDALDTDDRTALSTAIAAIEMAPPAPELADALFAAGRACEDRLHDPARALAIYDRIGRELPDARVAIAASRRAAVLRAEVGANGEHAARAQQLAELIANADARPTSEIVAAVTALSREPWPGAVDAALFLAELLRRTENLDGARAAYQRVATDWPASPQAVIARRGAAGAAIEAHEWKRALAMIHALPAAEPADVVLRDDLLAAVARGKFRERLYAAAWIVLLLGIAVLLASLGHAIVRARRRPALRPPVEVLFLAPFGTLLAVIAYGQNMPVAPSVAVLTAGTLGMAWLSGAALDLARSLGSVRLRAVAHAGAAALAALALGYISLVRAGLLDVIAETVRYGPGA